MPKIRIPHSITNNSYNQTPPTANYGLNNYSKRINTNEIITQQKNEKEKKSKAERATATTTTTAIYSIEKRKHSTISSSINQIHISKQ